jgi:hypothetical protein
MSLLRLIDSVHPFIGGNFEAPMYISFARALLEQIAFVVSKDALKHLVNYTTITLINKGTDGLGNDIIFSINNNLNDPESIDFIANKPTIIEIDDALIPQGGLTVSVTKVDNNAPIDLGFSAIVINERRF